MKTFKTIVIIFIGGILLSSCNKETTKVEEKEREINVADLPTVVKNNINKAYPGSTMTEADEITNTNGGISYDVVITVSGKSTEVMYDSQGNFLGAEDEDGEEETEVGDDKDDDKDEDKH